MSITISMLLDARIDDLRRLAAWLQLDTSGHHIALAKRVHNSISRDKRRPYR